LPKLISGQLDVEDLDIDTGENAVADASGSDLVCSEGSKRGGGAFGAASVNAAAEKAVMTNDTHRAGIVSDGTGESSMNAPAAYFITFTRYGTWLAGRAAGWVDRRHNTYGTAVGSVDAESEAEYRNRMRYPEHRLDEGRRTVVLRTIREVADHRGWRLWAVHVRSNHVHIVVTTEVKPEKVMVDLKAWSAAGVCGKPSRKRATVSVGPNMEVPSICGAKRGRGSGG
jgi:hypothetical protein